MPSEWPMKKSGGVEVQTQHDAKDDESADDLLQPIADGDGHNAEQHEKGLGLEGVGETDVKIAEEV